MIDIIVITSTLYILTAIFIKRNKRKRRKNESSLSLAYFRKIIKKTQTIREFEIAHSDDTNAPKNYTPGISREVEFITRKTGWGPIGHDFSSSVCTHKLQTISPNKVKLQPLFSLRIFSFLLFFVGSIALLVFGFILVPSLIVSSSNESPFFSQVVATLFSPLNILLATTIVFSLGILSYKHFSIPITFDKRNEYFYRGKVFPKDISKYLGYKKGGKLNEIHSLQIINGTEKGTKEDLPVYELNLVMTNASRVHLIEHGALKSMRKDTQKLAEFLDVLVWDATLMN